MSFVRGTYVRAISALTPQHPQQLKNIDDDPLRSVRYKYVVPVTI